MASDEKNISMKLSMQLDRVDAEGNRVPTGHKVVFTSAATSMEDALKAWYLKLWALSGCPCDPDESVPEMATRVLGDQ